MITESASANVERSGASISSPLRARNWALVLPVLNLGRCQQRSAACCSAEPHSAPTVDRTHLRRRLERLPTRWRERSTFRAVGNGFFSRFIRPGCSCNMVNNVRWRYSSEALRCPDKRADRSNWEKRWRRTKMSSTLNEAWEWTRSRRASAGGGRAVDRSQREESGPGACRKL